MATKIKIPRSEITQELLKTLFEYDSLNGNLVWKTDRGQAKQGQVAGYVKTNAHTHHRYIRIGSVDYGAHRLVWLFHHGQWPEQYIDHIDRNPQNNRIENLRDVTHKENMQNHSFSKANKTGFRGVYLEGKRYYAALGVDGFLVKLGRFETADDASIAYRAGRLIFNKAEAPEHADLIPVWPMLATSAPVRQAAKGANKARAAIKAKLAQDKTQQESQK